jgi:hypothetical protein
MTPSTIGLDSATTHDCYQEARSPQLQLKHVAQSLLLLLFKKPSCRPAAAYPTWPCCCPELLQIDVSAICNTLALLIQQ